LTQQQATRQILGDPQHRAIVTFLVLKTTRQVDALTFALRI